MKTKILTLAIILLSSIATFAQTYNIINGTVINATTSTPVQNQSVYIVADSTNSLYSYYNIVYTNQNGFYADTICSAPYQTTFYVSTSDCNGAMATGSFVSSYQGIFTLDFTVQCNPSNPANCTAYFYIIPDTISGMDFYFYDQSNPAGGNITSWYWDFGDGSHCIMQNTFHTYSIPGWYNVCLTIATDSGCTATYCDSIYADTISLCHAYFQYTAFGNTVSFNGYTNIQPATFSWCFGDGTGSTLQNPVHQFTGYGPYFVCLTIAGGNGCTDTYCQYILFNSSPCNIYVTATSITNESSTGAADGAIDIDVIGGTPPYIFNWSNGATTQNVSGLTAGYYDVTVTDSAACQTWATFEVLDASDSANWNYIDTLITNIADTCFNFQPANAYIYSYNISNNNTISITWIVFDITGTSYGFVTLTYSFNCQGYYLVLLSIDCFKGIYNFTDQIHIGNYSGINTMNISDENITVFPNPVADNLNISINLPKSDQITVNIFNTVGKVIYTEKANYEGGQKVLTINTASLTQGLYFVQLNYNGQKLTHKFIK